MAEASIEKEIPVSAQQMYKTVAAYENYAEFVDGVKKIQVTRSADKIIADYELSMMGKDIIYSVQLKENEAQGTVEWSLVKGDFFKKNNGGWKITPVSDTSCKVKYWLDIEFGIMVPGFVLKGLIKTSLPTMVEQFAKRAQNG